MDKQKIIAYLKSKKETFKEQYKITNIAIYDNNEKNKSFELKNCLEFIFLGNKIADELHIKKVNFVFSNEQEPKRLIFNE